MKKAVFITASEKKASVTLAITGTLTAGTAQPSLNMLLYYLVKYLTPF